MRGRKPKTKQNIKDVLWEQLRTLRDIEASSSDRSAFAKEMEAYVTYNNILGILSPTSSLPRDKFLVTFSSFAEDPLLDEAFDMLLASRRNLALRFSILMFLHGASEVQYIKMRMLAKKDIIAELLHVITHSRQQRISPRGAPATYVILSPPAMSILSSLLTGEGDIEKPVFLPIHAAQWVTLGIVPMLATAFASCDTFDHNESITGDVPHMIYTVAYNLIKAAADASVAIAKPEKLELAVAAVEAFVDHTEWMAPAAVAALLPLVSKPNWLTDVVLEVPLELRRRAVTVARKCELEEDAWRSGHANALASALSGGDPTFQYSLFGKMCCAPGCGKLNVKQEKGGERGAQGNTATVSLKRCRACHRAVYCSKDCQAMHWKAGHKKDCQRARVLCSAPGCGNIQLYGDEKGKDSGHADGTPALERCSRCQIKVYCSKHCQATHWKAGHRNECVSVAYE